MGKIRINQPHFEKKTWFILNLTPLVVDSRLISEKPVLEFDFEFPGCNRKLPLIDYFHQYTTQSNIKKHLKFLKYIDYINHI